MGRGVENKRMLLDSIALGLLLLFVLIGGWRGSLASGAGLFSLALAYLAAILSADSLGPVVAARTGLPAMFGPVAAGCLAFAVTYPACGLLAALLQYRERKKRDGFPRSWPDRFGGAFFGALRGGFVVLLLTLLVGWLDAARDLGVLAGLESTPDTEDSRASWVAGELVESVVEAAISGEDDAPAARVVARMVARPQASLGTIQSLIEDDRFHRLQRDELFWTLVENGAGDRAINQSSFYNVVADPDMRQKLAGLGLVSEEAAADPELFRHVMAAMLSELGPRLKGLRDDPELYQLAEDPEIIQALESGNTFALLTHPGVQRVVARAAGPE